MTGLRLMILAMLVFAIQDGLSQHLASRYNVITVVTLRYWAFALFVIALSTRGGLARAARTKRPALQIFRGVLLVAEICVMVLAFTRLGLIEAHAVFAAAPLIAAALSALVLAERVGWRRWSAIAVGLVGVLIILRPGIAVFRADALIALTAAAMFALYHVLTRLASREDSTATSFFYTGVAGAAAVTLLVPFVWEPPQGATDWALMGALCVTGALGHYLLIQALSQAEASALQPFSYFHLVFASAIGLVVFGEALDGWTMAGGVLIVGSGLYTLWRARVRSA